MTDFIGLEHLIAYSLVHLTEERFVHFSDIYKYRKQIQKYWNSNHIDSLFCGDIDQAVHKYPDYFELHEEAGIIILKSHVSKEDLRIKFEPFFFSEISLAFQQ